MPDIQPPNNLRDLPLALVRNMIVLAASGFGVVVALAWNEWIKYVVDNYITPLVGKNGSAISLFIYAATITCIAVIVTMQLTYLQRKLEFLQDKITHRTKNQKKELS
jgi:uncharacterized membrane protein (DUF106 family)